MPAHPDPARPALLVVDDDPSLREALAAALTIDAWALLPNHVHLLLRMGTRPLSLPCSVRSLLTGYAGVANRRSHRVGPPLAWPCTRTAHRTRL